MGPDDYRWFSLSLRIAGHGMDLDDITRSLGLAASQAVREGQPIGTGDRARANRDVWTYNFARKWDQPLDDLLLLAEETLRPKMEIVRRLAQRHEVVLWCSYQTNLAQGGFELAPSRLSLLSELGIPFIVSVLSWGEVKE